nr:ribonuclease H-like domain-containing protein [Tanacetum cinerariifolium]
GRVLEKVGLAAPIVLAAAESTGLDLECVAAETLCKGILECFIGVFLGLFKPFEDECDLSGTGGATDMGGGEIKLECLGVLTSSGKHSRIPLHRVSAATHSKSKPVLSAAARTIGAARPTFSKTRPHISPYTVSKSKAPIRRPFIRHITPKLRLFPPRVNTANPARVNTANPSAINTARVKAAKPSAVSAARINAVKPSAVTAGNPQQALKDKGVIDSGCSRHMTGNISYLSDFEELNGGYVAFDGNPKGGKITGKGKIKTEKLDFNDVYYVK